MDPQPAVAHSPLVRTLFACAPGEPGSGAAGEAQVRLLRDLVAAHDGRLLDRADCTLALFERPIAAVRCALRYLRAARDLRTATASPLAARVAIHLGEVTADAPLPAERTVASLLALAAVSQILLSRAAFDVAHAAADASDGAIRWLAHGRYRLPGGDADIEVCEVGEPGIAALVAPADSDHGRRIPGAIDAAASAPPRSAAPRLMWVATTLLAGTLAAGSFWYALRLAGERDRAGSASRLAEARSVHAETLKRFFVDLLTDVDPQAARDREVTVHEVLDRAAANLDRQSLDDPRVALELRLALGRSYLEIGAFAAADRLLGEALERMAALGLSDTLRAAEVHGHRGRARIEQADAGHALADLDAAQHIIDQLGGEARDSAVALSLPELRGRALIQLLRYREAETQLRAAIAGWQRARGDSSPDTRRAQAALADLMMRTARPREAHDLLVPVVASLRARLGDLHLETARAMEALATALARLDDHQAAVELQQQVVATRAELLGTDHPDHAASLRLLGVWRTVLGALGEAEEALRQAIAIQERLSGPDALAVVRPLYRLAQCLAGQQRHAEAEACLQRAIVIAERDGEPTAVGLLIDLLAERARLATAAGRHGQANADLLRAVQLSVQQLGAQHPDTLQRMEELAILFTGQGQLDAAQAIFERILQAHRDGAQPGSAGSAARTLCRYSLVRERQGALPDAVRLLQNAQDRLLSAATQSPAQIDEVVDGLLRLHTQLGDWPAVATTCERALRPVGADAIDPARAGRLVLRRADALLQASQPEAAQAALLEAWSRLPAEPGDGATDPLRGDLARRLAELCDLLGQPEQAESWRRRAP